jgi:hypothetical protein
VQRDHNHDSVTFTTPLGAIPTQFDYDSEYLGLGARGTLGPALAYRFEGVYETGEGLSTSFDPASGLGIPQTREDIEAWAFLAGMTWSFRDRGDTRVDLEFIAGSGDDDRLDATNTLGGNRPGTDDRAFNGLGYVNTGLALAPELPNLLALRLGASTSPFPSDRRADWLRLGISGFLYGKVDDEAPLNVGTIPGEEFLGGEIDLLLDWRITSDVVANIRYGIFIPGEAMPDGEDDPRHFFYAGVTYGF